MFMSWGWIALGLALTFVGAEALVRAAASLAARFGIPPLVIGLTVVAWGTSAPELVVSTMASLNGQGGIALGNVVGSNIFNIAAIVGIAALICPLRVHVQIIRFDIPIMIAVSILLVSLAADGGITRIDAAAFVLGLLLYTGFTIRHAWQNPPAEIQAEFETGNPAIHRRIGLDAALLLGGLIMLVLGSRALVTGAVSFARLMNVSDTLIGLTIVAAGTSLPELATSVVAAWRKQTDIAVGNVVGSNIFNVLGILGVAGVVAPISAPGLSRIDLAMMVGCALAILPLARSGFLVKRWEGALLLTTYLIYTVFQWRLSAL